DGLHGARLFVDHLRCFVGVHEGDELLRQVNLSCTFGDIHLFEEGVGVRISILGLLRQCHESPLKTICARSILHFVWQPGAVWNKQSLVVQNELLVLGKVSYVSLGNSVGMSVFCDFPDNLKSSGRFWAFPSSYIV